MLVCLANCFRICSIHSILQQITCRCVALKIILGIGAMLQHHYIIQQTFVLCCFKNESFLYAGSSSRRQILS